METSESMTALLSLKRIALGLPVGGKPGGIGWPDGGGKIKGFSS